MEIKSVFDKGFTPYGQVHKGYELAGWPAPTST